MKIKTTGLLLTIASTAFFACSTSGNTGGAGGATSTTTGTSVTTGATMTTASTTVTSGSTTMASTSTGMMMPPAPPTLGAEIDRMGRPAINTALNTTFLKGPPAAASDDATRGAAEDAYNAASDPTMWVTKFAPTMATQLAVLDSIDGNCTNQIASCKNVSTAGCYSTLAGVFANDQLWVKTTYTTCNSYLFVEADALGVTNTDCGGRRPVDDVIKTTYSLTVAGDLTFSLDDGITPPAGLHPTTFPFLAAPH